jgi:transposase
MLGRERTGLAQFICSDMWLQYFKLIAKKAGQAIHNLDRFYIAAKLNKALDEIRASEAKELARQGYEPVLKRSLWCFLKREENLTEGQRTRLSDLLQYDLKSVRGYLLKQGLQLFWEYATPYWAGRFLDG